MKDKIIIGLVILVVISLVFNVVNFVRISNIPIDTRPTVYNVGDDDESNGHGRIEVADVMTTLQRHMNKLWFAGKNENWPLAAFYIKEMNEAMDDISRNKVKDEHGNDLSKLIEIMGRKPLDQLDAGVKAQETTKFKDNYLDMINGCNSCHTVTKHEFIVIQPPTVPAYDNQVYNKAQ